MTTQRETEAEARERFHVREATNRVASETGGPSPNPPKPVIEAAIERVEAELTEHFTASGTDVRLLVAEVRRLQAAVNAAELRGQDTGVALMKAENEKLRAEIEVEREAHRRSRAELNPALAKFNADNGPAACTATYSNPSAGWGGVGCDREPGHDGEHAYGSLRWTGPGRTVR